MQLKITIFIHFHPRQACTEVLDVVISCLTLSTSFYMMHVKFYMHKILTAAGNFCKNFQHNLQNLNAADIFQF